MISRYELAKWDALGHLWRNFLSPCRPDATDLASIAGFIEAHLGDRSGLAIAILGSTPEFRDVAQNFAESITVIDQNPSMIQLMRDLQLRPNPSEESIVGEWIPSLDTNRERFDLVLSDLTQSNVEYNSRAKFYESVSGALRPGGLFVDRIYRFDGSSRPLDMAEVASYARDLPACDLVGMNEVLYKLLITNDVIKAGDADLDELYSQLKTFENAPGVLDRVVEFIREYLAPASVTWHWGRSWSQLVADYPEELELVGEERRMDDLRRGFPSTQCWRKRA